MIVRDVGQVGRRLAGVAEIWGGWSGHDGV
jgi:hypothetical protein